MLFLGNGRGGAAFGLKGPAAALFALFLAGCAGTPVTDSLTGAAGTAPDDLPPKAELSEAPFFPQTAFHCGPAAMAAALNDTGLDTTPDGLAEALFTPGRQGTFKSDVIASARRNGRLALPVLGMTGGLRRVADGRPVLILQNLGLEMAPKWHYALLIGYDLEAGEAILRSGTTRRQTMALGTLEHTWRRGGFWGVTVVPPEGPVPTATPSGAWMAEATGIERAGLTQAARTAYRTAAETWPDAAEPALALGNLAYGSGDLAAAERAFEEAAARDPTNDAALNNLAYTRLKRGDLAGAESAVERAIALDGPNRSEAEATRAEIEAAR
ncbi:PA2778 family cysteine peptidase [Marivibrio halodurans]|uniref:PA2778 family cysteine peptidase n=1 Tax=Marivibrio halodurans TaxID=2039722 RepID=A0A8J7S1M4_9PROT|nr:PA2778 family cysteine peptidase [Marivibrio halodurans]MBP5858692.1 PA2778 family cysteine peptidase [Marivibrio halodurans]